MDYTNRDAVLVRWCLVTLLSSLCISLILSIVKPWGMSTPTETIWFVFQWIPSWLSWLIWPMTNTLFVLLFVMLKTDPLFMNFFWYKSRIRRYTLALLQSFLITSIFFEAYSLLALVIASMVMSFFGSYFRSGYDSYLEYFVNKHYMSCEHEEPRRYTFGASLIFFYVMVVVHSWHSVGHKLFQVDIQGVFIITPFEYFTYPTLTLLALLIALFILAVLLSILYIILFFVGFLLLELADHLKSWSVVLLQQCRKFLAFVVSGICLSAILVYAILIIIRDDLWLPQWRQSWSLLFPPKP